MAGYIPLEKMSEAQLRSEIDRSFKRWTDLANGACQDPFWPDGMNMNLVRSHIICYYQLLQDRMNCNVQMSLFAEDMLPQIGRQIPPLVPDTYMVLGDPENNRLSKRIKRDYVFGYPGQYKA